jgi:hypothetical protein
MATFEQAHAKFLDWRTKLIARLQQEKSLTARDIELLLRPPRLEHVSNVTVTYLSFPVWLAKYDSRLTRGMQVNLNSYRAQRQKHVGDVVKQLDEVAGKGSPSLTGKALLDDIGRANYGIFIMPWVFWDMPGPGELDGDLFLRKGFNQTATHIDLPNAGGERKKILTLSLDGMPDKVNDTRQPDGSDALINYTPHMFDSHHHGAGTSGMHAPGLDTDEVLFHELLHAARRIHGVPTALQAVDKSYTNEEEFIAVVLSNIYLSEKGKRQYRAGHSNLTTLPNPRGFLNNAQNVNMRPRDLLANFRNKQRLFYRDLADISAQRAPFNPVREYHEELKRQRRP